MPAAPGVPIDPYPEGDVQKVTGPEHPFENGQKRNKKLKDVL
uniref:Uncharacterized protein n=1 Tax=Romanomermis culicivorax TaxID=13658 RepID=A0A915JBL7_ROMCU